MLLGSVIGAVTLVGVAVAALNDPWVQSRLDALMARDQTAAGTQVVVVDTPAEPLQAAPLASESLPPELPAAPLDRASPADGIPTPAPPAMANLEPADPGSVNPEEPETLTEGPTIASAPPTGSLDIGSETGPRGSQASDLATVLDSERLVRLMDDLTQTAPSSAPSMAIAPARPAQPAIVDRTGELMEGLFEARENYRSGDHPAALALYEDLAAAFPSDTQVLEGLIRARTATGDLLGARSDFDRLADLAPEDAELLQRAVAPAALAAPALFEPSLARLAERHGDDAGLLGLLGQMRFRLGQPEEAIGLLERAWRLSPDDPRLLFNLAVAYDSSGQSGAALEAYQRALRSDSRLARPTLDHAGIIRRVTFLSSVSREEG